MANEAGFADSAGNGLVSIKVQWFGALSPTIMTFPVGTTLAQAWTTIGAGRTGKNGPLTSSEVVFSINRSADKPVSTYVLRDNDFISLTPAKNDQAA